MLRAEERFWLAVDTSGDCWLWTKATDRDGYGKILVDGKRIGAHRLSYLLHYGEIPNGLHVMHTCDNPPCVRPEHLTLGTMADNIRDSIAKGRFWANRPLTEECRKGHPRTEENTYRWRGRRYCRLCQKDWQDTNWRKYK